jgi:hypothetical protein
MKTANANSTPSAMPPEIPFLQYETTAVDRKCEMRHLHATGTQM